MRYVSESGLILSRFIFIFLLLTSAAFAKYDVVVIGAGPAGLMAAIAAKKEGASVLVVEKRPFEKWATRQNVISIDSDIVELVRQFEIFDFPISPMRRFVTFQGQNSSIEANLERGSLSFSLASNFINRDFGGTVKISEIEEYLYLVAKNRGIDIKFDVEPIESRDLKSGATTLKFSDGASEQAQFIIEASGARSALLEKMNITRIKSSDLVSPTLVAAVGHYNLKNTSKDGEYRIILQNEPTHPYYTLGLVRGKSATIYLVPESGSFVQPMEVLLENARKRIKIEGQMIDKPQVFDISVDRPERFIFGGNLNFISVGDAAHKADPFTGAGVSMALRDSVYIGAFLRTALSSKNKYEVERARSVYAEAIGKSYSQLVGFANHLIYVKQIMKDKPGTGFLRTGLQLANFFPQLLASNPRSVFHAPIKEKSCASIFKVAN